MAFIVTRQAAVVGLGDAAPATLIASGGALVDICDAPRAFSLHGGLVHLAVNLALGLLFGTLWCRFGRVGPFTAGPRRVLAATTMAALGGMASLMLAAAMTDEPRIGASGGVYALIGALWSALFTRREILAQQTGRGAIAWVLPAVLVAALPLVGLADGGNRLADHLSHLLGFAFGVVLGFGMEKPRAVIALAALAGIWLAGGVLV